MKRLLLVLTLLLWPSAIWAAAPVVQTRATSRQTSTVTTAQVVTLPASIASGDLIIVCVTGGATGTFTWPGSWVEIADRDEVTGEQENMTVGYLAASGGETTVTVTSSANMRTTHVSMRISGAEVPSTQAPEIAITSGTATDDPDPPNLTPTGGSKDYLWIACAGSANGAAYSPNYPGSYVSGQEIESGGTTTSHTLAGSAERTLTAASENPGTFVHSDAGTRDWVAATIAIHPSSGAPPATTGPGWWGNVW